MVTASSSLRADVVLVGGGLANSLIALEGSSLHIAGSAAAYDGGGADWSIAGRACCMRQFGCACGGAMASG